VAIDSMTHFESLSIDMHELRELETSFINAFKREGVTTVLLRENDSLLGQMHQVTSKIPFIVDTYILLRYVEMDSSIRKAFLVLKMRGSDHDKDICGFKIGAHGIEVESTFAGREGIMSGITHHLPRDAFVNAFGKNNASQHHAARPALAPGRLRRLCLHPECYSISYCRLLPA
jgi:circadian clock protein KaiC